MYTTLSLDGTSKQLAGHLKTNQFNSEKSIERIASGKRINTAMDDASGVAISMRLDAQARGIDVSIRNARDGISAAQILDAALVEIQNMAVRIKELAVQKGSGTMSDGDKANVDAEIDQLNLEMTRIASSAKFNTWLLSEHTFNTTISGNSETTSFQFPSIPTSAGSTVASAEAALETIAAARGKAGAFTNRLEHTVNNLINVSVNTRMAHSRIVDADLALESASLAKSQVLQQTTSSMLAQANASQQFVLQLIQYQ
jgi:flagellin